MRLIYTRQAKSFLEPDAALYNRPVAHMLIAYMVRASGIVRGTSMKHRTVAVNMVRENMMDAWAEIHRAMRPYFFKNIDDLFSGREGIPLPDLADMDHIHPVMHFCFDVLEDLDRLTALLQADTSVEDGANTIFNCWSAVSRATSRLESIENRIRKIEKQ